MHAEVVAIGDELVSGQRLDTNSRWLSAELGVLGIPVAFHVTAADTLEAGLAAFRTAAGRADIVVATGGLGPTADDLTRDVLAALAGVPLEQSQTAVAAIESRFTRRGMPMPESNLRQALFPAGSREIPNPHGTAPGIDQDLRVAGRSVRIFALPGVPAEMKRMWQATVAPTLAALLPEQATIIQRRIKCFGAGESAIEALLPDLIRRGRDPLVGITAHEATITLRIAARGPNEAECREKIAATEVLIRDCLGQLVFGEEDDELEDATLAALAASGGTLAIGEAATAGRATSLAAQAAHRRVATGRSGVFLGGIVPADDGVADAVVLAERARATFGGSVGLGIGSAYPAAEGRTALRFVIAHAAGRRILEHVCGGGPDLAASRAAKAALDLVRTFALEGPAPA